MVTKCYTSDTLCIKDMIDNDVYEYIASKNEFHWQLCDSTKTINGPWVFCGLPGLILEAQDKAHLFSFRLVGLMSNQELKKDWLGKGEKIDRISFLKKKYKYRKNLKSIFNAEMGTNIPENKNDTRYLDGLEPDFKQ